MCVEKSVCWTRRGSIGWQQYGISDGKGLTKLSPSSPIPASAYLGALGMPGLTAWVGLISLPDTF